MTRCPTIGRVWASLAARVRRRQEALKEYPPPADPFVVHDGELELDDDAVIGRVVLRMATIGADPDALARVALGRPDAIVAAISALAGSVDRSSQARFSVLRRLETALDVAASQVAAVADVADHLEDFRRRAGSEPRAAQGS